jgi:hypothetical protein
MFEGFEEFEGSIACGVQRFNCLRRSKVRGLKGLKGLKSLKGFGFWVLGFGFWDLGFGFWVLGLGFWGLGFEARLNLLLLLILELNKCIQTYFRQANGRLLKARGDKARGDKARGEGRHGEGEVIIFL